MSEDYKKLISELNKQGLTLIPINRDSLSIKDEPKWEVDNNKPRDLIPTI